MARYVFGKYGLLLGAAVMMAANPGTASAQKGENPVIAPYGTIYPAQGSQMHPDAKLRYRVVFSITKAAADPAKVNPSLEKVARYLNLLGADGVRPQAGDIVAIVHGGATPSVASDAVYAEKTGVARNPNIDLIEKLRAAGVTVAACSQALHGNGISPSEVADGVRVDDSALTTLTTLQLRGWALMPD